GVAPPPPTSAPSPPPWGTRCGRPGRIECRPPSARAPGDPGPRRPAPGPTPSPPPTPIQTVASLPPLEGSTGHGRTPIRRQNPAGCQPVSLRLLLFPRRTGKRRTGRRGGTDELLGRGATPRSRRVMLSDPVADPRITHAVPFSFPFSFRTLSLFP